MPSALEQALQRLDPGAKHTRDDFLTDWWNTTLKYGKPALQQAIDKADPGDPMKAMPAAWDVVSSPFRAFGEAYVGRDPYATARDRRIGGHVGEMVVPLPGAAEEETAGMLADVGRAGVRRIVPRSAQLWDEIHHMDERGVVEDVPIHWLRRLAHSEFADPANYKDNLKRTMEDIQTNGIREPVVVKAGVRSRNAVLERGRHTMNIEAAARLGYTHVPVTIEMGAWPGRDEYGTTHLEQDLIPTAEAGPNQLDLDLDETRYLKPSAAFKSLQPGAHSDPELAWAAREAIQGPRTRGYHGTTRNYSTFRETNAPNYGGAFDTQMGTHGGFDPAIAANFAGSHGRIIPADIPPHEQIYPIEQSTQPHSRYSYLTTGLDQSRRLQFDTYDMANTIAERGFRRNPKLMIPYLRNTVGAHGNDAEIEEMARELAHGYSVQVRPGVQPKTLSQLLREQYVGNVNWQAENWKLSPNDPDFRQQIIQGARESFGQEGRKAYSYVNTAGHELQGAMDPTSFTVFDPAELKSPFDPTQPLISEDMWKQLLNLPDE